MKANLPQDMGRPRWGVAGSEMGRRIYRRRWDVQDGKWQVLSREQTYPLFSRTKNKMDTLAAVNIGYDKCPILETC